MTKYYIAPGGAYIGGFDGAPPPPNSFEVPTAPERASDIWDGKKWVPAGTPKVGG